MTKAVVHQGEGPGAPLFWVKNKEIEIKEGRKAGRASKTHPPPPPLLVQGVDPLLKKVSKTKEPV